GGEAALLERAVEYTLERVGDPDRAIEPFRLRLVFTLACHAKSRCAGRRAGPSPHHAKRRARATDQAARRARTAGLVRPPRPRPPLARVARGPRPWRPPRSLSRLAQRNHAAADHRRRR